MHGLTKRQREIVDYIETYISKHRHSPSYREIQHSFGFSSLGSVYNHIQTLKRKGVLSEKSKLTLHPAYSGQSLGIEVPLIGKLRGGMPIETFAQVWMVHLPVQLAQTAEDCYLIRVEGEGLIEEMILENDLLLVQPKSEFEDGETIIATVGGTTTLVKKAYSDPPYLRLASVNPQVQSLILREDHVEVQGIVTSLFRNYPTFHTAE